MYDNDKQQTKKKILDFSQEEILNQKISTRLKSLKKGNDV